MDKIAELRASRAKKIDALSALVDKMNADDYVADAADQTAYDATKVEIDGFDAKIARVEEANRLKATVARPADTTSRATVPARPRSGAIKNFKGDGADERAFRFGQFVLASMFGNEKAGEWCRENGLALTKAQSEGVATAGGFLVPDEFSTDIINLRDSYGLARRECKVWPMGRDSITVPKLTSGLTAYAVGESTSDSPSAITASTTAWGQVMLTAKKWGVLTYLSPELDEDAAVNIGDILAGEIAYAFAYAEDVALFSGDGTSTYHGIQGVRTIFNAQVGVYAGAVDAASGHDTMAEIDATDLAVLMGKLPQYAYERGNPKFYASQTMWSGVFERLIGASGGVTKDQASGRTIRSYNGFPVEITPAMLAPAAAGTDASNVAMILFGDMSMAVAMGDRRGMTIARSTDYKFGEDMIAIKGTERFDIVAHGLGSASAAGPLIALMGE